MRILFVNHGLGMGGAEKSLINIIEITQKLHTVYVLTPFDHGLFYDTVKKMNVTVIVRPYHWWVFRKDDLKYWTKIRLRYFADWRRKNIKIAKELAQYAIDNKIDLLHTNTSVVDIGARISRYSGIKHVWHLREFGDSDLNIDFLEPKLLTFSFMNRYSSKFICVSKAVKRHYTKLSDNKKIVIYNGVPDNAIFPKRLDKDVVKILIAGRICKEKGQQEAVQACQLLYERGINNYKLYIAGENETQLEIPSCISDNIEMLSYVNNMSQLRNQIDFELVCSEAEAFGRVTVEAMFAGCPVVGSCTGGTPEIIQDGKNGFLYQKGNIADLADKMEYFISNRKICKQMGEYAVGFAKNHFKIDLCVANIMELYEKEKRC